VTIGVAGHGPRGDALTLHASGRGIVNDFHTGMNSTVGATRTLGTTFTVLEGAKPGRHVIPIRVEDSSGREPVDAFFAVDVLAK